MISPYNFEPLLCSSGLSSRQLAGLFSGSATVGGLESLARSGFTKELGYRATLRLFGMKAPKFSFLEFGWCVVFPWGFWCGVSLAAHAQVPIFSPAVVE